MHPGLRDQSQTTRPEKLRQLSKLIFKKYLRDTDGVLTSLLPAETKRTIQRKLTLNKRTTTNASLDADGGSEAGSSEAEGGSGRRWSEAEIFDDAQAEALSFLSAEPYFTFLKSDVYLNFVGSAMTATTPSLTTMTSADEESGDFSSTTSSTTSSSVAGTRPTSQG